MTGFIVIAVGLLFFSLISERIEKSYITLPIALTLFGWLVGNGGLGLLDLSIKEENVNLLTEVILSLAEITLILVLFNDASRINMTAFLKDARLPLRMLVIGMPLTILIGAVITYWLATDIPWALAFLVAAILTPTDATLGQVVVKSPEVPQRIRRAISVESGLNDGIALPVVVVVAIITSHFYGGMGEAEPDNLWLFSILQVTLAPIIGVLVGYIAAKLMNIAIRNESMVGAFQGIAFLSVAGLSYALSEVSGGNGFISTFISGMVFGNVVQTRSDYLDKFMESEGQLFTLITFLIFGALLVPLGLEHVTLKIVLLAVCFLTFVRMVPIAIACSSMNVKLPTKLFLGWFGPRGVASILFALLVITEYPIPGGEQLLAVVALTVMISIFVHGVSAKPLADRYGAWAQNNESNEDP